MNGRPEPGISEFSMASRFARLNLQCNPLPRCVTLVSAQPHVLKSKLHKAN